MMYENDKLVIPEKFKKMSISELRREQERIYQEIKQNTSESTQKQKSSKETVKFYF